MTEIGRQIHARALRSVALPMADSSRLGWRIQTILARVPVALTPATSRRLLVLSAGVGLTSVCMLALVRPELLTASRADIMPIRPVVGLESGSDRATALTKPLPPPNHRWVRTTPSGVSVELLGVAHRRYAEGEGSPPTLPPGSAGEDLSEIESAWTPEGRSLPHPLYAHGDTFTDTRDVKHYRVVEVALRIQGNIDNELGIDVSGPEYRGSSLLTGKTLGDWGDGRELNPDLCLSNGEVDRKQRYASIHVDIASGPWSTKAEDRSPWLGNGGEDDTSGFTVGVSAAGKAAMIGFSQVFPDGKGHYSFVVTSNVPDSLQSRIVAVDKDGREYDVGGAHVGFQSTIKIDSSRVPYSRLRCLRYQVRPYRTVWFNHVALYPEKARS